jgi:hypothetical protein
VKKANVLDDIYLNSQKLSGSYTSGTQLSLPQNTSIILGDRPADAGVDPLDGSIANFRLFNRALTGDEVWQLYAYQKEYFGHGNLDMTLKSGRLGIGTSEPRAVLDVNGTMHANGAVVQLQTRTFGLSFATTSYTFADTGAYVDITPKFSNSKFFLMFDGLAAIIRASDAAGLGIQAFRSIGGGTDQRVYSAEGLPGAVTSPSDLAFYNANGAYDHARISISFSDTPNTSSRIRYKIYARAHVGGRRADLGNSGHQPLTFTVFEIAQ